MLVVFSWGGNYLYFESKQLDEPIFMEHFYEKRVPIRSDDAEVTDTNDYVSEGIQLTFYYLTNKYEPVDVVDVYIDGAEVFVDSVNYDFFGDSAQVQHVEQEFRHHYLKSVTVGIRPEAFVTGKPGDRWTFENMAVYFDNQEMMTANIGKVSLFIDDYTPNILEDQMSSSGDNKKEHQFVSRMPLTLDDISVPFANEISDVFEAKVHIDHGKIELREELGDGKDMPSWFEQRSVVWENTPGTLLENVEFPFRMETDERLSLNMFLNPNRTSFLELAPKITGTTESGESFVSYAGIINHPYLTQLTIEQLIAEKEGEKD